MKLFVLVVLLVSAVTIDALNKQKDCKCRSAVGQRLIGGSVASRLAHPWYANITVQFSGLKVHPVTCGAVIVNEKTVLTAGHCIPSPVNNVTIGFMRVEINGKLVEVDDIIKHPDYVRIGYFLAGNDLSIFKLKTPLAFNNQVQPGCFNLTQQAKYNNLKVVGYGSTTPITLTNDLQVSGINPSENFKEGQVGDKTLEKCGPAKEVFICVDGFPGRNKTNVCIGDTGSPLISESNGKSYVVGITGFPLMKFLTGGNLEFCTSGSFVARLSARIHKSFLESVVGDDYCH